MNQQLGLWSAGIANAPAVALSVRESRRAQQMILQVVPPRTIEVIVPRGISPQTVESFVHEHRAWIDRAERELIAAFPAVDLRPSRIELVAVAQTVRVDYGACAKRSGRPRYDRQSGVLHVGDVADAAVPGVLRQWLLGEGRRQLKPWLARVAGETCLEPARVQVRLQKTRWGSCSSSGTVSLNAALLLVPPALVRYLLVHELCHLRHMSHSRAYWRTVAEHEPAYRRLDRTLADCWQSLPAWVLA